MSTNRKPTGFYDGHGKMICVGDRVLYESGFTFGFVGTIVEHEGAFGVFLDGNEFFSIQELSLDDEYPPGIDFEVLEEDA